ncbi:MAG: hypothetical protein HON23_01325, partial [Rickettsiales bacterium]|nr:hypothetical protein [Rickettsiales bacterium]
EYGLRQVKSSEWDPLKLKRLDLTYVRKEQGLSLVESDEEEARPAPSEPRGADSQAADVTESFVEQEKSKEEGKPKACCIIA